MFSLKL
jgi:cAMP-specific phosphodiesterase 4